jgi:hypothetical protein
MAPNDDQNFMDADFERVELDDKPQENDADDDDDDDTTTTPPRFAYDDTKTLFDVSLKDSDWNKARIPFCRGENYIDAKLAFMVDLEGSSYGIAVPYDAAVAIVQESEGEIVYIQPDDDSEEDNFEWMEIMAAQVKEHLGEELDLRKTPKVLTISGGLNKYTDNWENDLFPEPVPMKDLLEEANGSNDEDDDDADLKEFYDFMKQELGEKEFKKTMDADPLDLDPDVFELFKVPGMGTEVDDLEGMEEMLKSMISEDSEKEILKDFQPDQDGVALKLIGYNFNDGTGKAYSLVKLLQPYTLVGRYLEPLEEGMVRFELLTPEEEKVIIPKLEELCLKDLEKAGLSLAKP